MSELTLNERVVCMRPSATLAMTARAAKRRQAGHPVIGLSAGEPDFVTPKVICDAAVAAIQEGFTHYTNNKGIPALREAISAKLARDNGVEASPDQIVCSNGAKQSVAQAVAVLCREGDEAIIPAPYWVSYPEMVRFAGGTPVSVLATVESGYRLTPEQLEAAITPKTRLLILCSPSNPTGAAYSGEQIEGLAAVLRRHPQVFVIADEIYEHIRYDVDHVSMASCHGMGSRTVTVNGFSKAYAMTGWRLGYLAAAPAIVAAVSKLQSQLTHAPSSISQRAGVAALAMSHDIVLEMVASFKARRDFVLDAVGAIDSLNCPKPEGAFYIFPSIAALFGRKAPSGRIIDTSEDMCVYLLEEHDLALVPGHAFGDPEGIRLSYAASMSTLEEAMERFSKALSQLS